MEIKKYGLGSKALPSLADTSIYGPDIIEMEGGGYYKVSEVDAYLESIGAGGVSGSVDVTDAVISMIKIESDKADKEAIEAHNHYDQEATSVSKAMAWQIGVVLTRAEKIRAALNEKTLDQHRDDFERLLFNRALQDDPKACFTTMIQKNYDGRYKIATINPMWWTYRAAKGIKE